MHMRSIALALTVLAGCGGRAFAVPAAEAPPEPTPGTVRTMAALRALAEPLRLAALDAWLEASGLALVYHSAGDHSAALVALRTDRSPLAKLNLEWV